MKKVRLTKVIASTLIVASLLALNPIGASAEWKQNSTGWWNTEGNSWSVGWRQIDSKWYYFDKDGYMKTGWVKDGATWYYLNTSGDMATNTTVSGYAVGSNGAWIESKVVASSTTDTQTNASETVTAPITASTDATTSTKSSSGSSGGGKHSGSNSNPINVIAPNIVSVFYKLDDLSITMMIQGEHTLKAYYGDDISKKAKIEETYGVFKIDSNNYKSQYASSAWDIVYASWNESYKIINDNGTVKLASRTLEEREQKQEEKDERAEKSLTIFYYLKGGELAGASEGIQELTFFGDEDLEKVLQTYGMLIVNRADYGDFSQFRLHDYNVVEENGQMKLTKKSENILPTQTTTSSAVTIS